MGEETYVCDYSTFCDFSCACWHGELHRRRPTCNKNHSCIHHPEHTIKCSRYDTKIAKSIWYEHKVKSKNN